MNLLSVLSSFVTITYLFFGLYILLNGTKQPSHQIFFLMSLSLAWWSLCAYFVYSAESYRQIMLWFRLSSFGFLLYYPLLLHFTAVTSGHLRMFHPVLLISYTPAIFFIIKNFHSNVLYKDFTWQAGRWNFILDISSPWTIFLAVYFFYCFIGSILLLYRWRKVSDSEKAKRQAFCLIIVMSVNMVMTFLDPLVFLHIGNITYLQVAPIIQIIWFGGIIFAVHNYRMFSLNPARVGETVLSSIYEIVILADKNQKIIFANNKATSVFQTPASLLAGTDLADHLQNPEAVDRELEDVAYGRQKTCSRQINVRRACGEIVTLDIMISAVYDKFHDFIGTLILGSELLKMENLKDIYPLTEREMEIILHLSTEKSNNHIAELLHISEATIKTHITHIYEKLGISNKVQLLTLLKQFNAPLALQKPIEKIKTELIK